jgi:DNA repair protein RecN (Recombination protein N)
MLRRLQIRNFAIVDQVSLEFADGMTVLTGETGAGKSILVDALGLVLGERGGSGLTRPGADRAEFSAEFDLSDHGLARAWLVDQALDVDDECILRRVIGSDGRSRAFVNGNAVTLQNLKSLGELLVDIHGQHFHQSLVRRSVQRDLLDHFGGLTDRRNATRLHFEHWRELSEEWQSLESANADRASMLELLAFQVAEFDSLNLAEGEYESLIAERLTLQNSGRLAESVGTAMAALSDGEPENAQSLSAAAMHAVENALAFDERLQPSLDLLREAEIQISEAYDRLRRYAEALDADPARRDGVEERLDAIQGIARKHRVEPQELVLVRARVADRLQELQKKQTDLQRQREDLDKQAKVLPKDALEKRVTEWQKQMMELQAIFVEYNKELEKKQKELTDPVFEKVMQIIKRLATNENVDVVMDKATVAYVRGDLDLTDRAIQMYNSGAGGGSGPTAPAPGGGTPAQPKK